MASSHSATPINNLGEATLGVHGKLQHEASGTAEHCAQASFLILRVLYAWVLWVKGHHLLSVSGYLHPDNVPALMLVHVGLVIVLQSIVTGYFS